MSAGRHPTREQDTTVERLSVTYGGERLTVSPPDRTTGDVRVFVRASNGGQTSYDVSPAGVLSTPRWLSPERMRT